jgi:hypothetical protein
MIVNMTSKYTSNGQAVRILCIDKTGNGFPVVACEMGNGGIASYTSDGKVNLSGRESKNDLVEVCEFEKGQRVLVWDEGKATKYRRYFICRDGLGYMTSAGWTEHDYEEFWENCIAWKEMVDE